MKMLSRAVLAFGALLAMPAMAQPAGSGPAVDTQLRALVAATNSLLQAANAINASYTIGVASTAASGTFYTTGTTAANTRAVMVVCPAGTSETITLTGPNGNTLQDYVLGPKNYDGFIAVGWSGNTAGCTVQGLF